MKMTQISFLTRLFDLLAPRACPMCGRRLSISEQPLCAACNLALPRTNYHENALENPVARLFWGKFPIEKGAAFLFYKPHSSTSRLIYKLKYFDSPEIGYNLGQLVASEYMAQNFFHDITALVPVPLTRKRIIKRGYNQSVEIARGIKSITGLPIIENAVKRTHFSESQTHKDQWSRLKNVENAFQLCHPEKLSNQHILLIDDVMTTGATLTSLAKELMKAENIKISVLALCFAADK